MALLNLELPTFGGLNVTTDGQEVGAAMVDGLNVDLSTPGQIRTRPGHGTVAQASADYHALYPFYGSSATPQIILGAAGNQLLAYDPAGTLLTSKTLTATATETSMVAQGIGGSTATTAKRVYIATNGETKLQRFDGSKVFAATTVDTGRVLASQSPDNRLVIGGYQSFGERVAFSDPGAPETFGANNYVDLDPGDGERITAMGTFGNLLFVFKRNTYYVFHGNSVDGSGNPIFNFREVDTGVGCISPQGVTTGPDGLYFVHLTGVYRTTGGAPVLVSGALNPLFNLGAVSPYYSGSTLSIAEVGNTPTVLAMGNRKLYLSAYDSNVAAYRTFVYDFTVDAWTVWDINARSMIKFRGSASSAGIMVFGDYNASHWMRAINPALTQDTTSGVPAAFTARHRTGFWAPQQGIARVDGSRWVHNWILDGTGSVTVKTADSDAVALGPGATVTLGTAPAVARGWDLRGVFGTNFSIELSGTAPWSVSRVIAEVH
jgi:hypothetical protein